MQISHKLLLVFLFSAFGAGATAQSFRGLSLDNYAGIPGLLLNPANAADSRHGFELHLASINGGAANDYFTLGKGLPLDSEAWDDGLVRTPRDDNSLYVNADAIGPSLFLGLGKRTGLGLVTRLRSVYNIDGFNGRLYEGISDGFDGTNDFAFDQGEHHSTLHAWGEASVVLGTVLLETKRSLLKGGLSVKYLRGAGGVYTSSPRIDGSYDANAERLRTAGQFTYGRAGMVDFSEAEAGELLESLDNGWGFDAGLVYEWRPDDVREGRRRKQYRLKVAASVVDLGSIAYAESSQITYNTNATFNTEDYGGESLEYFLEDTYDGQESGGSAEFLLPAALHVMVDLRLTGGLYLSALSTNSLRPANTGLTNHVPSTLTLAPRLETKALGLYAPLTFGGQGGTSWGAGVRLGPLMVGSATILSQVFSEESQAADVYVGLRLAFARRDRDKREPAPPAVQ